MALKLSKDLKAPQKPTNGFDITGVEGKDYNLDEIQKLKSRTASTSPLAMHVTPDCPQSGGMSLKDTADSLKLSNLEYTKNLLSDEPSKSTSNIPVASYKRPIVIFEEGTEDKSAGKVGRTVYDEIKELTKIIEGLSDEVDFYKKNVANRIQIDSQFNLITDKNKIPTVGAVHDYMENYREGLVKYDYMLGTVFGLNNGIMRVEENEGIPVLDERAYRMEENNINEYTLVVLRS